MCNIHRDPLFPLAFPLGLKGKAIRGTLDHLPSDLDLTSNQGPPSEQRLHELSDTSAWKLLCSGRWDFAESFRAARVLPGLSYREIWRHPSVRGGIAQVSGFPLIVAI